MKPSPSTKHHEATHAAPATAAAHSLIDLTVATSPREQKAYDLILPQARALAAGDVMQINLDLPTTASTCIAVARRLLPFRAFFATLTDFRIAALDDLESAGLALAVAHADYRAAVSPSDGLDDLVAKGTTLRDNFVLWGGAFASANLIDPALPGALQNGASYRDLAIALTTWVRAFRGADWTRIKASSVLTDETLAEAEAISQRILAIMGKRDLDPAKISAAGDIRSRVFTVAVRAYDQVLRGATYMRWDFGDVDEFTPSLFVKGPHKTKHTATPTTGAANAPPAAPTGASATTAAVAHTPATAPVTTASEDHVGLPDSSPFTHE